MWHSNDTYRRIIWRCNAKFSGKTKCGTPTLSTETVQEKFLVALNQLVGSRQEIIQACEEMRFIVCDCTELDAEIDALNEEIQIVSDLVSRCIKENSSTQQSQEEYNKKYNRLVNRYEKASSRLKKVTADRNARAQRDREIHIFIEYLKQQPLIVEAWDETLWLSLLDTATVYADGSIKFLFKNGTEINVPLDSLS